MIGVVFFMELPMHFDPYCFVVGLIAAISGIFAAYIVYKEYIRNHYYRLKILETAYIFTSAGEIFSVNEKPKGHHGLRVKLQNIGQNIPDANIVLRVKNKETVKTNGTETYEMISEFPFNKSGKTYIHSFEQGMIVECECSSIIDIENISSISIAVCSGTCIIKEIRHTPTIIQKILLYGRRLLLKMKRKNKIESVSLKTRIWQKSGYGFLSFEKMLIRDSNETKV